MAVWIGYTGTGALLLLVLYLGTQLALFNWRLEKLEDRSRELGKQGIETFIVLGTWRPYLYPGDAKDHPELSFAGCTVNGGKDPVCHYYVNHRRIMDEDGLGNDPYW